ncbi:hypothetical protein [Serratia ficaria]|uniref:hypothetical protein n=1 Tax=Serratia ficaria TaxID=61651 RepID=UPI00077C266F|nr:hypothetical protein [Serratia ficaria]
MKSIEIKKAKDNRIAVTLLVDDVELANELYLKAKAENIDVSMSGDVVKMLNKSNNENEDNFMSSLNKKLKIK